MINSGLRKKVICGRKNMVLEDHREGLKDWIKCMQYLNFKVPLLMVIQRLIYVAKGERCLWIENFKDGEPSIKWDKYFVEDPQWGLAEAKTGLLGITR